MGWSAGLQLDPFRLARSDSSNTNHRRRKMSLGAVGEGLGGRRPACSVSTVTTLTSDYAQISFKDFLKMTIARKLIFR